MRNFYQFNYELIFRSILSLNMIGMWIFFIFVVFIKEIRETKYYQRNNWWFAWQHRKKWVRYFKESIGAKSLIIKRYIESYFRHGVDAFEERNIAIYGIHRIKIKTRWKYIYVIIYSSRPGLIIGHHGSEINKLTELLTMSICKPIKVNVVEYSPFDN